MSYLNLLDVTTMKKLALISVANKSQLAQIASRLLRLGYDLASTGGTANALRDAGFDVMDASELTGFPEILRDLVKTLHPKIHGALLPPRTGAADSELATYDIRRIDFLYVGIYELLALIEAGGYSINDIVEKSDMGGPAMLASGAKGAMLNLLNEKEETPYAGPVVACTPEDCFEAIAWIEQGMPDKQVFVTKMAARAFWLCAQHRAGGAIALSDGRYFGLFGEKAAELKYGENPQQAPASHFKTTDDDPLALHRFEEIDAKPGSLVNCTDIDGAVESLVRIIATVEWNSAGDRPRYFAVAVKHANPCGAAFGSDPVDVAERLVAGDDVAIFGGVIATNFPVDLAVAQVFRKYRWGNEETMRPIDGVVAPVITDEAIEILRRKGNRGRLLRNEAMAKLDMSSVRQELAIRQVRGGFLVQPQPPLTDLGYKDREEFGPYPTQAQCFDALLGIGVCSTTKSNTITVVKDGMVIANAAGQQDRAFAAELAVLKAQKRDHSLEGATAVSDSYFPFPDGLQILIEAGVKFVIATSGSLRDAEVRDAALAAGITFWRIPDKLFRMFAGH